MTDKSLNALLEFLDWTADKGLMAKNTVGGRKAAVSAVLGILDPEEKGDVTAVDLDSAMTRFVNLQGKKYNTSSLNVYRSRTNAAISDFRKWLGDPLAFKPQANKVERKPQAKAGKVSHEGVGKSGSADLHQPISMSPSHQASANVFPIPIRENVVVRIHGLPFDLTASEADKIANVVKAMATPS
jgi:hypothetical protein